MEMSIIINAPIVERRLREEAARHGVTADAYAVEILATHLALAEAPIEQLPFYTTATPAEWQRAFETWVDSHPRRTPLPPDAFDRASFYEEP